MSKDVVYIDAEDDITDIIGKVKKSKEKIVAIVPPKRVGALQSAVNLKLLAKTAKSEEKQIVIITGNQALLPLAAVAKIPVARTLQTKPEIPEVTSLETDDGEIDVIEGEKVPVGVGDLDDAVKTKVAKDDSSVDDDMNDQLFSSISLDDQIDDDGPAKKDKKAKKGKGAIPNFDKFRKKVLIGVAAAVVLIGTLIWALVFAPKATVIISTKMTKTDVSEAVTFVTDQTKTDTKKGTLLVKQQQITKKSEVEFDPTGEKYIGTKAKGTVKIFNCDNADGFTLPAGTKFTSSGLVFATTAAVSVPKFTGSASSCTASSGAGSATVAVEAAEVGDEYNLPAQSFSTGMIDVTATGSAMTGGEKHKVKAVSAEDINKAKEKLASSDEAVAKKELAKQLSGDYIVIESSLKTDAKEPVSTPAVDQEATGKAKLTSETVYTVYGVDRSQIKEFLTAKLNAGLDSKDEQKVYSTGVDSAYFTQFVDAEGALSARLKTTAEIGPKIDEQYVKDVSKGKRYGEVQGELESISGVEKVDIKFSFFWVSTVPNNDDKITVKIES